MANGNGATPGDYQYQPSDWTPAQWKAAWDRGAIGQNTGLPIFPPTTQYNSRGVPYNPARVGAGGITGGRFPRGDEQPPPATPAAYKPGDPPPPAPANENINDPTPPAAAAPAAPAAPPAPVTPGQYSPTPWSHPQVAGIPRMPGHGGVIGNPTPLVPPQGTLTPPPDKQGNRYWNPVSQQQPFADQINRYAHEYGIPPALLSNLLRAESHFDPNATGPMTKYGQAGGIAQFIPQTAARYHINPYDPDQGIRGAAEYIRDLYNQKGSWGGAVAAYNGAKSLDVSQYRGSPEGRALIAYTTGLDGGAVQAGPLVPPPQNYRPHSYTPPGGGPSLFPDRPSSQWGRDTPGMFDDSPGNIPHQREIPGIMQALAPFLMIGLSLFSKGAALPMLSFYGGYLKARTARQEKDAKALKTQYQDHLKELKARMQTEQLEAAGSLDDPNKLMDIAIKNGDSQLEAALTSGGTKAAQALFQARDNAYQDVSKTALAERREELAERREDREAKYQDALLERGNARDDRERAAADAKVAKAKAARDKAKADEDDARKQGFPNPGAVGPGDDSDEKSDGQDGQDGGGGDSGGGGEDGGGSGEQGAATPPATPTDTASAEPPAATPAAAPAAPQQAAVPDTGGDQLLDAQGNPRPRRSDVQPAVYTGQPPTAQPVADTTAAPAVQPGIPRTPFEGYVSDALNGKEYNQLGVDKKLIPQVAAAVEEKGATIDNLPASPDYLNKLRSIDKPFGDFIDQLSNYNAPLPTTRGISGREYFNRAMAAAKKANPNWSYQNFKRQEEFADQKGIVQTRLTRAAVMGEAAGNVAKDLKVLQEKGYGPNRIQDALQKFTTSNFDGKSDFTNLYSDLKSFTQEDQALKTGTPTVTETEAQQAIVAPTIFVGTPEQIRDYISHNIDTAAAAIEDYQERWTNDADGKTRMPGRNDHADAIIAAMPYWNSQTGTFDKMPPDVKLPPILSNSIPHTGFPTPPADAIKQLKDDSSPEMQKHFDEIFGPDAAKHALGQ